MRTPRRQGRERAPTAPTTVSLELQQVLSNLPNAAAYVVNPALRILAANRVATALGGVDRLGRALHYLFTDPAARRYYPNWEAVARSAVSALRVAASAPSPHPEVSAVVDQLGRTAPFAAFWGDPSVAGPPLAHIRIQHPDVGRMTLSYRTFGVRDVHGQYLIVATAPPGSPSADALTLLGTLDATRNREHPQLTNGRQ